jgi:hypothetical protein
MGSAFPTFPQSVSRGAGISELNYSSLSLQPADLFALLTDQTRLSPRLLGLLLPGFRQHGHPYLTLDIATAATGRFPRTGLAPVGFTASFAALSLLPAYAIALSVCIHPSHGRGVTSETPVLSREDDP